MVVLKMPLFVPKTALMNSALSLQYNLSLKQHLTDDLSMDAMIGTAKSEFDNPVQTTLVAEKRGVAFAYDYRGGNRDNPALTYGAGVFDPTGWTSNSVRLRPLGAENTLIQQNSEFYLPLE